TVALAVASVILIVAAARHLLATEQPLVDLRVLRIHSFGVASAGAALYWMVMAAVPFLSPLLFQTVFGWSAVKSGLVVLLVFVGNVGIKPATTVIYRRGGFRPVILTNVVIMTATTLACATFTSGTPIVVIGFVLLVSGVVRSVAMTGYSTLH